MFCQGYLGVWLKIKSQSKLFENRYGIPNRKSNGKHISNTGEHKINGTRNRNNRTRKTMCGNGKVNSTRKPQRDNTRHPNSNNYENSRPVFYTYKYEHFFTSNICLFYKTVSVGVIKESFLEVLSDWFNKEFDA